MTTRRLTLLLGALAAASMLMGAGAERKQIAPRIETGAEIKNRLNLSGRTGWMLIDLDTGQVLDAHNADIAFAPASVAKLPTAAFALDALGPTHRFETQVLATAPVAGGRIDGDLILRGGGDPELDTDALADLAASLRAKGLSRISGQLIADGTAITQVAEIDRDQAADASYNASVSGLNLNFNRVHVKWDARKGKGTLSVEAEAERLSPQVDVVRVAVAPAKGRPLFSLTTAGGRESWVMAQEAYRGRAARWLPVKRPEPYAGEVFRTVARSAGVNLPAPTIGQAPEGATLLTVQRSRPLGDILRRMLRYSTNVTAEVTGAAATRAVGVEAPTLAHSADIMNAWAASVAGFPIGDPGFRFENHSGLSTESRVSPRRMVELLAALGRRSADPGARHGRLPGGIAGYLRVHNVAAKDVPLDYDRLSVVAKTGTMNFIRGLAGYIATPRGKRLAFAIFSNDLARRAPGGQRVNRRWMGRAKGLERALIRSWVMRVDGLG
ncbi:MAG: D-alanyl-D-alanine carboxypeptidase/D-alanyl-D-alanine-endopeptidase [Pseudomonadota bacterium]